MHEFLYQPEIVRAALVVGVIVSILFYERVQLTTGGAIVPAYMALSLPAPAQILVTLLAGYLTYLVVNTFLAKRFILYGRRKFEIEVLVGLGFVTIGTALSSIVGGYSARSLGLAGVGFLVPGIIAHDMFRQKPRRTLAAVVATTAIVGLFIYTFAALLDIAPFTTTLRTAATAATVGYPSKLLVVGAIVGVVVGIFVFSKLGLRSGGFISGAYLALVLPRPLDLLFTAVVAVLVWLVVTRLLMPNLLLFGRRKLSAMVLTGAVIAWTAELIVIAADGGAYVPWAGLTVMTVMVPALLANDAERQGIERTLWGAGITCLGVFGVMNLVAAGAGAAGVL